MAAPGIAQFLTTERADGTRPGWFPPTDLPELSGTVSAAGVAPEDLIVYARLWTADDKLVWHRQMAYDTTINGYPVYRYQTVYPTVGADETRFITFGTGVTGGYWRFVWYGVESGDIPWNATEAQVRQIIESHPDIGAGNFYVSQAIIGGGQKRITAGPRGRLARQTFQTSGLRAWGVANFLTGTAKEITLSTYQEGIGDFADLSRQYKWDMVALHPSTYRFSGDRATIRTALAPTAESFFLDVAPTISSISPANAGTVTVSNATFSWTQSNLGNIPVTWVRGLLVDNADPATFLAASFSQQGTNLNTVRSFSVPPQTLRNGHAHTWFGEVYKASGAVTKWAHTFTVAFTRSSAHAAVFAVEPDGSSIVITIIASALSDADFNAYVVKVRPQGASETSDQNIEVFRSATKGSGTLSFRLFRFPRNTPIVLSFYVRKNVSGDVVDSQPTSLTTTVNIPAALVANPVTSEYVLLNYHEGRRVSYLDNPVSIPLFNDTLPVASLPIQRRRAFEQTARLYGTLAERQAQYATLVSLYTNGYGVGLVYADAFGQWFDCVVNAPALNVLPGALQVTDVDVSGFEIRGIDR